MGGEGPADPYGRCGVISAHRVALARDMLVQTAARGGCERAERVYGVVEGVGRHASILSPMETYNVAAPR